MDTKLHPKTHISKVFLNVRNAQNIKEFYGEVPGLEFIERPELERAEPGSVGLYHIAILYKDPKHLATVLFDTIKKFPYSFQGSSDHLVSLAFYFADPEGNGVELYTDRPRSEWQWQDGKVVMGSSYIDPSEFISEHYKESSSRPKAQIGHIHLKVSNIPQSKKFYTDIIGFDITSQMPSALFVSAGGYHHHIGMNTWESLGAKPLKEQRLGLDSFEIKVGDEDDIKNIKKRLNDNAIEFTENQKSISLHDPSGNKLLFTIS